jgi:hypothetical protein
VAVEILAAQPGPAGSNARDAIHQEVAQRLRIDPMVKKAMEEAFAVVLDEFRDATLKDSAVLESVGRQVHGVTGGQMREFAQRLRDAAPGQLTIEQILTWADAHHDGTGLWPKKESGFIQDASGETWARVDGVLQKGFRGLPGGSSLARLLAKERGVRNTADLPLLREEEIVLWADAHFQRTGDWPKVLSGPVVDAPGEDWQNIHASLSSGKRGLPGGSSLARLLARNRGIRNPAALPPLTVEQILSWADQHHARRGKWPGQKSGAIHEAHGENWANINQALVKGLRGLSGDSSLAQLLEENRGVRNVQDLISLTNEQILAWADAHSERLGEWPTSKSGSIPDAPGENWSRINGSLQKGFRGLPRGSSLAQFLAEHRGIRNRKNLPELSLQMVLTWCIAHQERTGAWPDRKSGPIPSGPGETWKAIDHALRLGMRGLPGGSSLARFIEEHSLAGKS